MSREYSLAEMFMQLHEMPPPAPHYLPPYQMMHTAPNSSSASHYELTYSAGAAPDAGAAGPGEAGGARGEAGGSRGGGSGGGGSEGARGGATPAHLDSQPHHQEQRKRKSHHFGSGSTCGDDSDDVRSTRSASLPDKKQNHSEIEKRRRDKMNTYITELSSMVPMCGAMARKLDKLTVLRMAVQHLRHIRGALSACPLTARPCPELLSERELNAIVLQAAHDSFLLVVGCDRGRLLYVSASVTNMLHYDQTELVGQSLFDLLHPKDVAKVKEQFSASDVSPRERLIDAMTMLPVKTELVSAASRFCPGARRSFFCRIKCREQPVRAAPAPTPAPPAPAHVKHEDAGKARKPDRKYCVVQCTGYLKSWAPAEMSEGGEMELGDDGEVANMSCLVAVARALTDLEPPPPPPPPPPAESEHEAAPAPAPAPAPRPATRPLQFVSRHATDGKFLFVDQRVTQVLGFLPQELIGTSLYEYVSGAELGAVARAHKLTLAQSAPHRTPPYQFRTKHGEHAALLTHFKPFRNPWTKDVECLVANHTLVQDNFSESKDNPVFQEIFKNEPDVEMQRLIESHVESHKIGSAIAEVSGSPAFSPSLPLPLDLMQDIDFTQQQLTVDSIMAELPMFCEVRNNVPLSCAAECSTLGAGASAVGAAPSSPPPPSPPLPPLGTDSNSEATMAVIMSLLDAEEDFGATASFSGMPWPLP